MSDRPLHLALRLNLYRSAELDVPVELVQAADDLGYHSVWTAEAYGTDALSPLAYLAALTPIASSSAPRSPSWPPGHRRPWRCTP